MQSQVPPRPTEQKVLLHFDKSLVICMHFTDGEALLCATLPSWSAISVTVRIMTLYPDTVRLQITRYWKLHPGVTWDLGEVTEWVPQSLILHRALHTRPASELSPELGLPKPREEVTLTDGPEHPYQSHWLLWSPKN